MTNDYILVIYDSMTTVVGDYILVKIIQVNYDKGFSYVPIFC